MKIEKSVPGHVTCVYNIFICEDDFYKSFIALSSLHMIWHEREKKAHDKKKMNTLSRSRTAISAQRKTHVGKSA